MFNLFDILQSQAGVGGQALGQSFGLSPEQSRPAVEALLPALTLGLQRNVASDPTGFGRLFGLAGLDTRQGEPYGRPAEPDLLVGQLFGSPLVSQAVLQQAAAASGLGTQALRQMLPVLAGMVVAGIVHVLVNQPHAPAPAMREPEPQPPSAFPVAALWSNWIDGFLSSAGADGKRAETKGPGAIRETRPLEPRALPPAGDPSPEPEARTAQGSGGAEAPLGVLEQMFQTGAEVQERNAKAMQDIFDSFWSSPDPERSRADPPEAEKRPARSPKAARARPAHAARKRPSTRPRVRPRTR